jgi:predicted aspartyl protease
VLTLSVEGFSIEAAVDTGFDGGVLIPFPLFSSLGLMKTLSEDEFHLGLPDSRKVSLYSSRRVIRVGGMDVEAYIHSSSEVRRKVVGRELLGPFTTTLDGRKEELTLEAPPH